MFYEGKVTVQGSPSYEKGHLEPLQAINNKTDFRSKFGGVKQEDVDFFLCLTFSKPILIDGYALRCADDRPKPVEWTVFIDEVNNITGLTSKANVPISK